jgi:hypothetical protein
LFVWLATGSVESFARGHLRPPGTAQMPPCGAGSAEHKVDHAFADCKCSVKRPQKRCLRDRFIVADYGVA